MRIFFCLLMLMLLCPSAGLAQESALTAREAFGALPTSIFENTAEGLEDEDKQQLLEEGQSEFWELAGESRDVIVFRALPFRDSGVALRLFRDADDGSAVAAIGTLGTELCTVELWRVDASGRTVPVDVPQEPDIQEFFAKGQPVPDDVNPSVLICLGMGGLRAHPVFWNKTGMLYLPLANEIGYRWDGHRFQKVVRPHAEGSGEPAGYRMMDEGGTRQGAPFSHLAGQSIFPATGPGGVPARRAPGGGCRKSRRPHAGGRLRTG